MATRPSAVQAQRNPKTAALAVALIPQAQRDLASFAAAAISVAVE
jgi:hypothetical protein